MMSETESEQIRILREGINYEHFYVGDHEPSTLNKDVILSLREQLFTDPPIPFVPREDVQLEQVLKAMVDELSTGLPVIHIKDNSKTRPCILFEGLYLVGEQKVHLSLKDIHTISARFEGSPS
jgi:hypothetical protein